jgi:hypothetical protein
VGARQPTRRSDTNSSRTMPSPVCRHLAGYVAKTQKCLTHSNSRDTGFGASKWTSGEPGAVLLDIGHCRCQVETGLVSSQSAVVLFSGNRALHPSRSLRHRAGLSRDFRFGPRARVHRTPLLPSTQRNMSLVQASAKIAGSDGWCYPTDEPCLAPRH